MFLKKVRRIRSLATTPRQPVRLVDVEAGMVENRMTFISSLAQKDHGKILELGQTEAALLTGWERDR